MKVRRIEVIVLLGLMFTAFAACEYLPFMSAKAPAPRAEVSITPTRSATPTPAPTETPTPTKTKHRKRSRTPTPTPESSPTPIAQASPGTVITTGESVHAHGEIEQTIKGVEGHLATINRSRLSSQDAADYDRIKAFVADARAALKEQDDLRAHSLAEKAARLTTQLMGRVGNP
ncbi:MAG TPA: hypothetical protein VN754_14175 [Candidatus Binataceae bacterium]|nr:hypothetical protein [Candidatus Binataceae bacterium]